MPRAIWSGSISFGLVNIPVKLFSAVSRKNVNFNQIDSKTGARIKMKRVSTADERDVPYEDIVKGYELPSGEYITVGEDELAALDPEAVRTIDIDEFVDLAEIDPLFYDSGYYLVPDQTTAKAYKLLASAMEKSQKVGIAHFVMRTKQYLAAVRPKDGRLILNTMVYADEVVQPAEIGGFDALDKVDVAAKELTMATQLIESLTEEFTPEKYHDTYREAVLALIERKAAGHTEVLPAPALPSTEKVVDLMAALEASVKAAKEARARHPAAGAELIKTDRAPKPVAGKKPSAGTKPAASKKAPAKRKSA
jgi:DNA end-binding protein Ku